MDRVLKRLFGSEREEVTRDWRNLLHENLHNLHYSVIVIRAIKARRIK